MRHVATTLLLATALIWGCDAGSSVGPDDTSDSPLALTDWDVQLQDGEPPASPWSVSFESGATFSAVTACGYLQGTFTEDDDHGLSIQLTHLGTICDPPESDAGPVSLIPYADLLSSIDRYERSVSQLTLLADEDVRLVLEAR